MGLTIAGGVVLLLALYGWAQEPSDDPDGGHHDDHGALPEPGHDPEDAAAPPAAGDAEKEATLVD